MNFARQQEQAERTARRLIWLHAFASTAVVIGVDALATLVWHLLFGAATDPPHGFHLVNVGVVLLLIVGGAVLETARLREDGALIARRLGAVPVDRARDAIERFVVPIDCVERVAIRSALDRVLARDVVSPIDVPAHDNSAMDGWAVRSEDLQAGADTTLTVIGTAYAGVAFGGPVAAGEAVRVMTGAVMPAGCDAVVIQEVVRREGERIVVPPGQQAGQGHGEVASVHIQERDDVDQQLLRRVLLDEMVRSRNVMVALSGRAGNVRLRPLVPSARHRIEVAEQGQEGLVKRRKPRPRVAVERRAGVVGLYGDQDGKLDDAGLVVR
jgi:hypothetical protein